MRDIINYQKKNTSLFKRNAFNRLQQITHREKIALCAAGR